MQRKCHRCDRLFTPDSHSPWCPNCRAGKPVEPIEKAFKYTRYCIQCGKKFHTNDTRKVICGDWECEEKQRFELRRASCRKGKQK